MDRKWDLSQLYTSFKDQKFIQDIEHVKEQLIEFKKYPNLDKTEENLIQYLKQENLLSDTIEKLFSYVNLVMNADTTDDLAMKNASVLEDILASFANTNAKIQRWIADFDFQQFQNQYILEHLFILCEMKEQSQYLLDNESEAVLANMRINGSSAWSKYKDQLISSMTVFIDDKEYPLTEVLNMAYSKDKAIRKKAYEAEIASYQKVEQGVASALNAIKGESIAVAKMRGYGSVLEKTLKDSRMTQKTLDALLKTIQKSIPMFEKYFQVKAQHLGYAKGLPWYEMYAPIMNIQSEYPYEKGCDFVVKQFYSFSKNLTTL